MSDGHLIEGLIDRSIKAVEAKDSLSLRRISIEAISEAAIEAHSDLILLALVDYALSKVMSKVHYAEVDGKFYGQIKTHLEKARDGPKKETIKNLEAIEDMVIKLEKEGGHYEENLIDKAKIKKAAKLYDQGLSLRRASEITGADPAKVIAYVGGSKTHQFEGKGRNAKRLKTAREVFS